MPQRPVLMGIVGAALTQWCLKYVRDLRLPTRGALGIAQMFSRLFPPDRLDPFLVSLG